MKRREPFKFMLYMGMLGSSLLFLVVFLIFLRKEYVNQNIPFKIPNLLWLSTASIILSSISLEMVIKNFNRSKMEALKINLIVTLFLSLLFMYFQFNSWKQLFLTNQKLYNNTSASYIYILTGLHLIHILAGVVALFVTIAKIFKRGAYIDVFIYTVNPPNILNLQLLRHYWHFLGVLWLFIFVFLQYHAA
jgi:cytochrome c oxidase subunit III